MSSIQKQSSRLHKVKNEEQRQQESEMDNAALPDKDTVPSQAPGRDKKKNLKKDQHYHQKDSDESDEDDYGDDDDSDEMSSFIAKDEEVEQELIEEHRRRRKNRSPKHGESHEKHHKKQQQLEDLDDDDYEVIKENVGIDIKKPKKKRLKKTANLEREQDLQNDAVSSHNNENSLSLKHEQNQATEQIDTTTKQRRPQAHDQIEDDSDYGDYQQEQRVQRKQIKQQSYGEPRAMKQSQREAEAQMLVDSSNQLEEAFNADEIDDPFCTQADKIIAETDIPERLQVKLTDRLDPSPEELEIEAKWILDKLISMDQNKYAHLIKQPQVRSKIQKVLRMFRCDQHLDIPMIARYRQYEFKPELDENVIWDIFNLDLEFGKFQRHKEQINDFLKKVMVFNPQFKLYEESLMYASSQSELNNFNALIRFLHSYYNQELTQQVTDQSKKLQPLKRDTVQLARQNKLDEFARRCMLSVPQFLENLQEKKMIHRPQDPAGQIPINLAQQYQSEIYNKELKVLHGVCNFAAQELAAQPYIRNLMKNNLRQHGFLATQPTEQGKKDLDIFHPSYRVKNIEQKPLHELCDVTKEQGDLYLDILQNEKAGLIKVDIMIVSEREREFKDMLERHYLPVDEPKKDFNIMRQEVLKNLIEIFQKEIVKEIKDEIKEEAENFVIRQCQNVYREQLMLGPFSVAEGNDEHQRQQEQQPAKKGRKNQEEDIIPDRERLVVMGALMHQADQNGLYQNNTIVTIAVVDKYGELVANQDFMHLLPPRKPRDNMQDGDRGNDMMRPNKPHKTEEEIEHQNDKQKLIELMEWNSVDLVVVAANQLEARNLKQALSDIVVELKNKATDDDSDASGRNSPKHGQSAYRKEAFVTWGSVEIPKLFSSSHNSQKLHKDAPQMLKQVISLCRFEQDPMCEMLNLWSPITSENQTLHLSMHPLQKLVNQAKLSEALEQVNIQSVNEIGIDINLLVDHDHMHCMLQFVSGLGPRKAKKYIQRNKASGKKLQSRGQIFKEQYFKRNVYTSTVAFTKIKMPPEDNHQTYDILDQTRIHQESYQIAMQIASDSQYQNRQANQIETYEKHQAVKMVIQSNKNEGTSVLRNLDLKQYYQQLEKSGHGHMKILVDMIIKEFTAPFKDPRELRMATKTTFGNQKLFYMLIDESPRIFKRGVIVTATVTKVLDKKAICKLENGLNAIINAGDILETQEEKLKDCLDFGHIITGRIDSIDTSDEKKFEVTLRCKHKHLQSHEQYVEDILGIQDPADVPQEDLKNQNFQPDQKKQQVGRFMPRRIAYDKFANISSRRALAELNDKDTGDFVFRPSTRGADHLTLTWKFYKKVYVHIDIQEQEKQPGATIGSRLIISSDVFANLREIVERYLIPCNRLLREVTSHPKFMEVDGHDELENELRQEKQNDSNRIPYKFTCMPEYPQHVVLMYQPKDKVVKEYIRVKPRGFYFHDKLHQTFIATINWFKENQRTRDYQRHLKRAKSPRVTGTKIPTGANQAAYPTPGGMNNQDEWEGVNQNWRSNDDNSNVKNERNAPADSGNFNAQPKSYGRGQRSQDQGRHFVKEEARNTGGEQWNSGAASNASMGWGNDPSDSQSRANPQPESNSRWGGNASSSNNWGSGNAMGSKNDRSGGQGSKGHGNSANQCYKCNQEGHFARECPTSTQGGGNACYKCNQEGHFAKDCTNADVRPQNNQGGNRDRPRDCFNCGESGHFSRECTQPKNESRGSRGRGRGRSDGNFGGDGQDYYRNNDDRGSKGYKRQRRDDGGSVHRDGGFDDNNAGASNVQGGWGSSYNTGQGWNNDNADMQQTNNASNPSGGNDWGAVPQQQVQMSQNDRDQLIQNWSAPADNNTNQGGNSGWGA